MAGNGAGAGLKFLPFKKALRYARTRKLKSRREWRAWCKRGIRPANIPAGPDIVYEHDEWQGWGHWLETGAVATQNMQFLPFKKALLYARSLKLKARKEWCVWSKSEVRKNNIPSNPEKIYKHDGWQGYGHWLGTGNVPGSNSQTFLPFKEALVYARYLKLKGANEWLDWAKTSARPANIPARPDRIYKHDVWQGYGHWLGTGNVPGSHGQQFLTFDKALLYARSLKLKSAKAWRDWCKNGARPANVPTNPDKTYKNHGWQSFGHWLGTLQ